MLDLDEVPEWIARPDAFVWLGLRMPDRDEVAKVAAVCGLADLDVDDYRPMLDGFEKDVLEAEQQVFADTRIRPVRRLYELKRQILELLVVVDALHEPLERLIRTNVHLRDDEVRAGIYGMNSRSSPSCGGTSAIRPSSS